MITIGKFNRILFKVDEERHTLAYGRRCTDLVTWINAETKFAQAASTSLAAVLNNLRKQVVDTVAARSCNATYALWDFAIVVDYSTVDTDGTLREATSRIEVPLHVSPDEAVPCGDGLRPYICAVKMLVWAENQANANDLVGTVLNDSINGIVDDWVYLAKKTSLAWSADPMITPSVVLRTYPVLADLSPYTTTDDYSEGDVEWLKAKKE